jgi:hypothetical protein
MWAVVHKKASARSGTQTPFSTRSLGMRSRLRRTRATDHRSPVTSLGRQLISRRRTARRAQVSSSSEMTTM